MFSIIAFSLIWSSAFIVAKLALESFDPFSLLSLRFFLSAMILLAIALYHRQTVFAPRLIKLGLSLGILQNALYLGLTFWALGYVSPSWVVIIVTCSPFMTTLLAMACGLENFEPHKIIGIAIGILGILLITGTDNLSSDQIFGLILALLGTLAFSVGTVLFRGKAAEFDTSALNFWLSSAGFVCLLPVALIYADMAEPISHTSIYALLYLVLVVNIFCIWLWFFLVRQQGADAASSYFLLNPASGLLLAFLVFDEPVHKSDILGVIIIALGLYIANFRHKINIKKYITK